MKLPDHDEPESAHAIVLGFVRGELPWERVESLGIRMTRTDDGFDVSNPRQLVVEARLRDIAAGLLCYRDNAEALWHWASIVLAASAFLELGEEIENTPEGELLLNALWDASFRQEVDPNAFSTA
jgi:hypothetical protein